MFFGCLISCLIHPNWWCHLLLYKMTKNYTKYTQTHTHKHMQLINWPISHDDPSKFNEYTVYYNIKFYSVSHADDATSKRTVGHPNALKNQFLFALIWMMGWRVSVCFDPNQNTLMLFKQQLDTRKRKHKNPYILFGFCYFVCVCVCIVLLLRRFVFHLVRFHHLSPCLIS